MNFSQLKSIIVIAEEKNMTHAAKKLFVSQSALSQLVHNTEKELGTKLFETHSMPLKLTYTGEKYIAWAKRILSSQDEITQEINDIENQKNVRLVIGIVPHRSIYFIPPVIKKFKDLYPDSIVVIKEHPLPVLHKMIDSGEIDLLIDIANPDTISYTSILLIKEEILLEIPAQYGIKGKECDLKEISKYPFIMLSEDLWFGKIARDICKNFGFEPKISVECRALGTAHSLVQQGIGVTFIPELFAQYTKNETKYYKIKNCTKTRDICAIYNNNKYMSTALKQFISILKDFWHKK